MESNIWESDQNMITEEKCVICNQQNIINENHVRQINGELIRMCPICYKCMND